LVQLRKTNGWNMVEKGWTLLWSRWKIESSRSPSARWFKYLVILQLRYISWDRHHSQVPIRAFKVSGV
jgi:hypothetical protein